MEKQANRALLLRAIIGGVLGGLHGYHVSPRVLDYKDNPAARKFSTLIDTALGTVLGASASPGALRQLTVPQLTKGVSAYAVGQTLPVLQATLADQRDATRTAANAAKVTSIPYNLQQFGQSNLGKGMAGGAAVAGLGGVLSGLLRRRTAEEDIKERSRSSMVGHDMLKYLLPAVAAGGVIGSLKQQQP